MKILFHKACYRSVISHKSDIKLLQIPSYPRFSYDGAMNLRTLAAPSQQQEDIKRSRFLTLAAPCSEPLQAERFLAQHRFADANHHCYAWRVGQIYRFNDDGEPAGTAGRPILQALDGQQLDQVVVLVARWFGGIKLGAGGLIRAYGGCAARCLQQAETLALIQYRELKLHIPFEQTGVLHQQLAPHEAEIIAQDYRADGLTARVKLPAEQYQALYQSLRDASAGSITITEH